MGSAALLLAVGGSLFVWLALAAVRRPYLGVMFGLSTWAWEYTNRGQTTTYVSPAMTFGGISIAIMDVATIFLVTCVLLELFRPDGSPRRPRMPLSVGLALSALWSLWSINLARGLSVYGLQPAMNSSREMLYLLGFITYGAVFGQSMTRRQLENIWFAVAAVLSVLGGLFVIQNGFGGVGSGSTRSLNSGQAVIVANAALLAIVRPRPRPYHFLLLGVFGLTVLVAQQRTVWAATLGAFVFAAIAAIGRSGRLSRKWARMSLGAGAVLVSLALLSLPQLATNVGRSAEVSLSEGTGSWRLASARALLGLYGDRSLDQQVFGAPAGTSLERRLAANVVVDVSPHNTYLFFLMTVGLVGLLLLGVIYLSVMRRAWLSPSVGYLFPLVAGQAIFSFGYQTSPDQGLLLGVFAAGAALSSGVRHHTRATLPDGVMDGILAPGALGTAPGARQQSAAS